MHKSAWSTGRVNIGGRRFDLPSLGGSFQWRDCNEASGGGGDSEGRGGEGSVDYLRYSRDRISY